MENSLDIWTFYSIVICTLRNRYDLILKYSHVTCILYYQKLYIMLFLIFKGVDLIVQKIHESV